MEMTANNVNSVNGYYFFPEYALTGDDLKECLKTKERQRNLEKENINDTMVVVWQEG